ncbi:hypothetical protein ACFVX9_39930 [Kitasatospora sp. NPDC058243]|uniref:DUF3024 domain-containing protein n=1 Tax=Kitasatospora sp. NPDC058243 TaxID=3346397 RepID=UPI0036D88E4E
MKISEMDRARLAKWAEERIPAHARAEVAVVWAIRANAVVVSEERAPWDGVGEWTSRRVARLRLGGEGWVVDGADRNGRWYAREDLPSLPSLDKALVLLDDPRHAFWG